MIRAAAKNYQDVAVVVSPADYAAIIEEMRANGGALSTETNWRLAKKAFRTTADYDAAISARLEREDAPGALPAAAQPARAQAAWTCATARIRTRRRRSTAAPGRGIAGAEQLHGKELSYNNLVDLDAAWQLASEFDAPAAAIIKHTNPCGCAEQDSLAEAYRKAFECDPVSAYGGVIGLNRALDEETAREIAKTFIEAIAAPDYCARSAGHSASQEEPAPAARGSGQRSAGGEIDFRRLSGADRRRRARWTAPRRWSKPSARPPKRSGGARIRLEGGQARQIERHRLRARRPGRGRGRRPDEPRGFGQDRRHEGRAAAGRHGGRPRTPSSPSPMAWRKPSRTAPPPSSSRADRCATRK